DMRRLCWENLQRDPLECVEADRHQTRDTNEWHVPVQIEAVIHEEHVWKQCYVSKHYEEEGPRIFPKRKYNAEQRRNCEPSAPSETRLIQRIEIPSITASKCERR